MSGVLLITASYDHTIKFWDPTTTSCTGTLQYTESQVNAMAISNSKEILATASNNILKLYSIESQQVIATLEGHTGNIMAVGFQKDDKWIYTCSEDKTIRIWDTKTTKKKFECKSSVNTVILHPNQGELISGEEDGTIRIFDLSLEKCVFSKNLSSPIRSISVSPDGNLVLLANNKGEVHLWKKVDVDLELIKSFQAHNNFILKVLFAPNGKSFVTCSADYTIKLWNLQGELLKEMKEHKRWVWDCSFSSDSLYLVTASSDQTAKLWELSKGDSIKTYKGHGKACVCIALNDQTKHK